MKKSIHQQLLECYVRTKYPFADNVYDIFEFIGHSGYFGDPYIMYRGRYFTYTSAIYQYYCENMPHVLTLPDKLIKTYFSQGKGYEDIQLAAIILAHLFDADETTLQQITKRRPKDMFYAPLASCMRDWYLKNVPPDSNSGLDIPYYLHIGSEKRLARFVGDHTNPLGGFLINVKTGKKYMIVELFKQHIKPPPSEIS